MIYGAPELVLPLAMNTCAVPHGFEKQNRKQAKARFAEGDVGICAISAVLPNCQRAQILGNAIPALMSFSISSLMLMVQSFDIGK